MSSTSSEPISSTTPSDLRTDVKPAAETGDRVYRIVWRWHFYAGMIIAPALILVAATGGLYIFKDELEAVVHPGVTYVEPITERVSYEQQVAAALAAVPKMPRITLMQIFSDPRRATSIVVSGEGFQYSYVDPYRGHYLGGIGRDGFFEVVLSLHRTMFLGTAGRIIVDLTTCWTIVLVVTGIYLWWPNHAKQIWGVWLPRLRRKPYVILRDLHSLSGVYIAIIAIAIALTGLIYSYSWGTVYRNAYLKTDASDMFSKPMISKSLPDAKDLSIDRFIEIGKEKMPGKSLTVWFPRAPNAVYMVFGNSNYGPQVQEMLFIDRASGEILDHRYVRQTKFFYWFGTWNYALHVGSVLGMTSKVLWLVTCLILMTAPVTGIWMWWERRPKGRLGLPRRVNAHWPIWLVASMIMTGLLLPTVGVSIALILVVDLIVTRFYRAWHAFKSKKPAA